MNLPKFTGCATQRITQHAFSFFDDGSAHETVLHTREDGKTLFMSVKHEHKTYHPDEFERFMSAEEIQEKRALWRDESK